MGLSIKCVAGVKKIFEILALFKACELLARIG
jgi:hypothetical protein